MVRSETGQYLSFQDDVFKMPGPCLDAGAMLLLLYRLLVTLKPGQMKFTHVFHVFMAVSHEPYKISLHKFTIKNQ